MKKNKKLSFVICAYKESPYLEECIKSLINQNVKCDIALSTSTPNNFVKKLCLKYKIPLYINKTGKGYYDDFLYAYNVAKTQYVTLCHQDDIYLNNFSEEVLKKINKNSDNLIIFSNYYDYKKNNIIKNSKLLTVKRMLIFPLRFNCFQKSKFIRKRVLSLGNPICSPTVTFNKKLIKEPVSKCPYKTCFDWYTWIDFVDKKGRFVYIKKPLIYRRINELSETTQVITDNSKKQSDYEIFRKFWPDSIAKFLLNIYSTSENNNIIEEENSILIVDDVFPLKTSTFRYQEFRYLLKELKGCKVLSTFESIRYSNVFSKKEVLDSVGNNVEFKDKILKKIPNDIYKYKLLYCVFLFNAYNYLLPMAEKYHIPFVFTLYPGGRFSINDETSDNMLKTVCSSKYFEKVIVTQQKVYDYLLHKKICSKEKIEFLFGGILLEEKLQKNINKKEYFGNKKDTLDICFVAFKYSQFGEDKGYDIFIETAKKYKEYKNIKFHVVGNFNRDTIDIGSLNNIKFYGINSPEWLDKFFVKMDIILSANLPGKIKKGSFDGFPTSSVLEAGLNEVAMFCTDELKLNGNRFKDDDEIVIIKHDIDDVCKKIQYYYDHPKQLRNISINGRKKILELYGYEHQIIPRTNILIKYMLKERNINSPKRLFNLKMNMKMSFRYELNRIYGKINKKEGK